MIISDKFSKEINNLIQDLTIVSKNNSLTDLQLETFLRNLEKHRYNILNEIKLYNDSVEFEDEKIKNINNEYTAEIINGILKIYIPEIMPSYKNIKTHTHKRIVLNIAEQTKKFENYFNDKVFIYIKIFDNNFGWDIDNKYIKPISDGLILSKTIKDDNIEKMFYAVQGEYSEIPHTEIFVMRAEKVLEFFKKIQ